MRLLVRTAYRLVAVLCAALALLTGLLPAGASAHGGDIEFQIAEAGSGVVEVTARWGDKDPVTEDMFAQLIAESGRGGVVGPLRLLPVDGRAGVYKAERRLPAGTWRAVVQSRIPPGRAEATFTVTGGPEGSRSSGSGAGEWMFLLLTAGAAVALACGGIMLWPRRRGAASAGNAGSAS